MKIYLEFLNNSGLSQNVESTIFSYADATIEIIDTQVLNLEDGKIRVFLKLLDSVTTALPIELNVEIMVGSELINLGTSVHFLEIEIKFHYQL